MNFHTLALGYLEEEAFSFTELLMNNKDKEKDNQVEPEVSDLEKEKNKQKTIYKEKK